MRVLPKRDARGRFAARSRALVPVKPPAPGPRRPRRFLNALLAELGALGVVVALALLWAAMVAGVLRWPT